MSRSREGAADWSRVVDGSAAPSGWKHGSSLLFLCSQSRRANKE